MLQSVNENFIDLGKKVIYETIQLDKSIQESIREDLANINFNQINDVLRVINVDVLNSIENSELETKRKLILDQISNNLNKTLEEIKGWAILDQRRAKKLMEGVLNDLKQTSSDELKLVQVGIHKLTQFKIDEILKKIRELSQSQTIRKIQEKQMIYLEIIDDLFQNKIQIQAGYFDTIGGDVQSTVKKIIRVKPSLLRPTNIKPKPISSK